MSVTSINSIPISPVIPANVDHEQVVRHEAAKIKPHAIHSTTSDLEKVGLVFNKKLKFTVDHDSNEIIVKVIDKETDKVIKELPPEELQRLHSNLREAIGFLFDESV